MTNNNLSTYSLETTEQENSANTAFSLEKSQNGIGKLGYLYC